MIMDADNGTSDVGIKTYQRKRRKIIHSDDIMMMMQTGFSDQIKAADGSNGFDRYAHRLSLGAFSNGSGPGECALRACSNSVLPQLHQSLNGNGGCIQNDFVNHPESGCTPAIKESVDNVERSDSQTDNFAQEHSHVLSSGLVKLSEGSTNSQLCRSALSDILNSAEFTELCHLLVHNFGVVTVDRVLNIDAINSKLKNGAYEASPVLYFQDIQKVWTKLQELGNEMVTLAKSLYEKSGTRYEQFDRKSRTAKARDCLERVEKADVESFLVCNSCEDGIESSHDGCVVCEKLKNTASIRLVNSYLTSCQLQDVPVGLAEQLHNDLIAESPVSKICIVCKFEVKRDDNSRMCGHLLCAHKFYHYKCLTNEQLVVRGPYWYCPSCLCRRCLEDKDDEQIILCDGCDQAYHTYCASPQLNSIPEGSWFCEKCDGEVKTMKEVGENMQRKVKIEDASVKDEHEASVAEL